MLVLGNRIGVSEYIVNADGCWVLLDQATKDKYCFNTDGEAWSLAMGHSNVLYLGAVNDMDKEIHPQISTTEDTSKSNKRGFDFTHTIVPNTDSSYSFGTRPLPAPSIKYSDSSSTNPFVFGDNGRPESPKVPRREKKDPKLTGLPKWFKSEDSKR